MLSPYAGRVTSPTLTRQLLRARDLADTSYPDPLTVSDLARVAALSPSHFSREFRRAFGEPPHRYLLTRRLELAAALLRVTDWTVAGVCFAVGAGSLGSFTASFTRIYGCSPTSYRRSWPPAARAVRIPRCVAMADARPRNRTFREDGRPAGS